MIFSFSRLNLYEQCPYRFFNKYILKKDEPITQPLALGKAVHKAIEDKIKGIDHEQAVLNGYMEAEFHKELSYDDISKLTAKAPVQRGMGDRKSTRLNSSHVAISYAVFCLKKKKIKPKNKEMTR